jgi:hypothetical protein
MAAQDEIEIPHLGDHEVLADDPDTPMLPASVSPSGGEFGGMSKSQALNLYTSHFLSMWNIRTYEFAAVRICQTSAFDIADRV